MPNPKAHALVTDLKKRFGEDSVMYASEIPLHDPISSGSLALDFAVGFGGLPSDRVVEIYGREGCIQGDAEIMVNRAGKGFCIKLRDLVHRFNGGKAGGKTWSAEIPTYTQREINGVVRLVKVVGAWASGEKTTYAVTTDSGRTIRATDEHPFLTERGWLRLDELKVDDEVHVRGPRSGVGRKPKARYAEVRIPEHPFANKSRRVVVLHRLIAEARENGLPLGEFIDAVRGGREGLTFLDPKAWAVHHQDHDSLNNDPDNLQVLSHTEHHRLHATEGTTNNVQFLVTTERVVSVEEFGVEETFDIEVEDDPHNFLANGFVVHNTGKTTLALLAMEQFLNAQPDRLGLILDLEHKMTKSWLAQLLPPGWLNSRVLYFQPDHIEQATNMYSDAVQSGMVCFALLDSIGGAPTARSNEDAEVGRVGGNAIGVGEFSRRAANLSAKYRCLTIGVNQVRANMNPRAFSDDTPGGRAWRHACILRIELARGRESREAPVGGEKIKVGYTVAAKVRKNHLAPEGRTASYWFYNVPTEEWGFGVDTLDEIARIGVLTRVIALKGSWYHHPALPEYKDSGDHKIQGLPALKQLLRQDEALHKTLASEILATIHDYGEQVAPISDADAPIEVSTMLLTGAVE